jgi:hypothetical protein
MMFFIFKQLPTFAKTILMKKIFAVLSVATLLATTTATQTGCIKNSSSSVPVINIPDISNFSIKSVSSFVAGASSMVSVASSTLASGTYSIHFNLSGANNLIGQVATMVFAAGSGTFSTPSLATAGNTNITITSITNSSGGTETFSMPVTKQFSDSTGLMTCKINGVNYRATHVDAHWLGAGDILSVHGVLWDPLTTITVYWDGYNGTTGSRYFNENDFNSASPTSNFNGSAAYSAPGIAGLSANGNITVSTISTTNITGTFQFTCDGSDSVRITNGAFSCKLN